MSIRPRREAAPACNVPKRVDARHLNTNCGPEIATILKPCRFVYEGSSETAFLAHRLKVAANMHWYFIIGLAVASNIDNLAVGMSYGVRGIRIGFFANLVIAAICFAFSEVGMVFGEWIGQVLPGDLPDIAGAGLLLLIGVRVLFMALSATHERANSPNDGHPIANWFARALAVKGDKVGPFEAVVLGVALSANALANAVSAGILNMAPTVVASAASIGSFLTIVAGVALGRHAAQIRVGRLDIGRFGTLASGIILVALAIRQVW
ncbi:manganese efflux pump (plasmid) [Mesorhizobium sp. AR07]|uniref:manganese efflux pump n=1 Tax=Mesorhizobium sp. AR07 TaxID=2865838 RepID=UPI00215F6095|nr:manganese efflux pump [Mesorhizobium sp. AR07]UVK49459.1 manganese efflux pump [Mesorhizobium sp. AR07]